MYARWCAAVTFQNAFRLLTAAMNDQRAEFAGRGLTERSRETLRKQRIAEMIVIDP